MPFSLYQMPAMCKKRHIDSRSHDFFPSRKKSLVTPTGNVDDKQYGFDALSGPESAGKMRPASSYRIGATVALEAVQRA